MKIIKEPKNNSKINIYKMSKSPDIMGFRDISEDETVRVLDSMIYSEKSNDGNEVEILSLMTDKGIFAGNSGTVRRNYDDICDIVEGNEYIAHFKKGTSKNGREFIQFILDEVV